MEETLLHFIWRFQQFSSREFFTADHQPVTVFQPGNLNSNAGPDFSQAKLRIGDITWSGDVEIHVEGKDWNRHGHHLDQAYDNVILHVVWNNEIDISRMDGTKIPSLELQPIVDKRLLFNYSKLFEPGNEILCHNLIDTVKPITVTSMLERSLAQRMAGKAELIFRELAQTGNDWEEIAWRMLCRNFGFKTNTDPFATLGRTVPLKTIKKEAANLKTIEALLFGQAGLLEEAGTEPYFRELQEEYLFKKKKYALERQLDKHQWKFLRLRPGNFPTIRIAQLAALIQQLPNLFSALVKSDNWKELSILMKVRQSSYWQHHYNFGVPAKSKVGALGRSSLQNLIINTVSPLLFAYGLHKDSEAQKESAMKLLTELAPEDNSIIKRWINLGMTVGSAFDSQALIELYNEFCMKKRCLYCSIGAEIVKST